MANNEQIVALNRLKVVLVEKGKTMFNLNESNRIVMSQYPTDMRKGVNTPCSIPCR